MAWFPQEFPFFLIKRCKRLQSEFRASSPWEMVRSSLADAEAAGLDVSACLALLLGMAACEEWRLESARKATLQLRQEKAERWRGRSPFRDAAAQREVFTERFIRRTQTLLILGYIRANGVRRIERRHWRPLVPALFHILRLEDPRRDIEPDREQQVIDLLRQRIIRLRRTYGPDLPWKTSRRLFREVYGTFQGKI